MFDIGIGEILVIAVVGLLVFGPDRLPEMAKQAGGWMRDLRRMVASARSEVKDSLGVDARYLNDPKGALSRDLLGEDLPTLPTTRQGVSEGVNRALGLDDEPTSSDAGNPRASGERPAAPGPDGIDPDAT
jgi:Tat protein translocase TatB subunit